jgi:hypothetical protein
MTPLKLLVIAVATLPITLPITLPLVGWLITLRDKPRHGSERTAAMARHPSARARSRAMFKAPCCGAVLIGADPIDLVAVTLHHESTCLRTENAA